MVQNKQTDSFSFTHSFQAFRGKKDLMFQIVDMLPVPIEIFAPDGTEIYLNRAALELNHIEDSSLLVGKFNLLNAPACMDQPGFRNNILRAFSGETVVQKDFHALLKDLVDRSVINEKIYESATMDIYLYPVWNTLPVKGREKIKTVKLPGHEHEELIFIVCVFIVKNLYRGREDIARAMEFLDLHWKEKFDSRAIANFVNMSVSQLYKLFHKHLGMSPGDYYRKRKTDHLKEKLADESMTIKEAFAFCGEDSRGSFARTFKKLSGLSPEQFREKT